MASYSGKYRVKNTSKYIGNPFNVVYRSLWERQVFKWLEANPNVKKWSSESVVVPYFYQVDKKNHRYFVDVYIEYADGSKVLVEIKPDKETRQPKKPSRKTKRYITEVMTYIKNTNKWDAAKAYSLKKGWSFEIWTEHTLKAKGIKILKPLKNKS